jgi:hypothetical protein
LTLNAKIKRAQLPEPINSVLHQSLRAQSFQGLSRHVVAQTPHSTAQIN